MNINAIMNAWNAQADEHNQWDSLSGEEMVKFTIKILGEPPKQNINTLPLCRLQTLALIHCPRNSTDWEELSLLAQYFDRHQYVEILHFMVALIQDNQECPFWQIEGIVDKPKGDREDRPGVFDHVYVDQHQSGEDSFYGHVYYPLAFGRYIKVSFSL